jgi:cytochrome c-type biogenesis protein CcmE
MRMKLLIACLGAVGAVWVIVFGMGKPAAIYSLNVSQFLKRGIVDETVRVQGTLVHGTLCKVTADCGYRFRLQDAAQDLSVAYDECIVPDTLRDVPGWDVSISVEGERCQSCHDFKATRVFAGHRGKYEIQGPLSQPAAPIPLCKSLPRM